MAKSKSLCKGKRISNPNKCNKIRGCKVAHGTRRTYCRKKHNKGTKKGIKKSLGRTRKRRSETARLRGLNKKQERELKNLGSL